MNSHQVELPEDVDVQLKFVEELAPYYRLADFHEEADDFIECLFDPWFIHWCLKLQDYGGSCKALDDGTRQKEEVSSLDCKCLAFLNWSLPSG